ncbi:MAG: GNAT family N-acetyltransferase [Carbonactinosporaceae bacterium]
MTVEVRAVGQGELPAAARLWVAAGLLRTVDEAMTEAAAYHAADPELVLVAAHQSEVVGAGIGSFDGYIGRLRRVAVVPPWRGRGLGRRMAGELERRLVARGARKARLHVYEDADDARTFWEHLGYAHIPARYLGKPFTEGPARSRHAGA